MFFEVERINFNRRIKWNVAFLQVNLAIVTEQMPQKTENLTVWSISPILQLPNYAFGCWAKRKYRRLKGSQEKARALRALKD
jgi:hypothetical protein